MGPLGGQEIFLIFIVILLLFGAKKLPELARGMGRSLGEFKKAKDEFEREIMTADQDAFHAPSKPKPAAIPARVEEEIASAADPHAQEHSAESEPSPAKLEESEAKEAKV